MGDSARGPKHPQRRLTEDELYHLVSLVLDESLPLKKGQYGVAAAWARVAERFNESHPGGQPLSGSAVQVPYLPPPTIPLHLLHYLSINQYLCILCIYIYCVCNHTLGKPIHVIFTIYREARKFNFSSSIYYGVWVSDPHGSGLICCERSRFNAWWERNQTLQRSHHGTWPPIRPTWKSRRLSPRRTSA